MSKSTYVRYNASIYFSLTPKSAEIYARMCSRNNASRLVRALIIADLFDATESTSGLGDIRLRVYRERTGKCWQNHPRYRVRLPLDLRLLVDVRSRRLGFNMTEYVAALLARHAHREGITRGGKYVRENSGGGDNTHQPG